MIEDYPNEYCLTSPDNERCAIIEGVGAVRQLEFHYSKVCTKEC